MRTTHECQQMNTVYSGLRAASAGQLRELFEECHLRWLQTGDRHAALLAYQIRETVRRKLDGTW